MPRWNPDDLTPKQRKLLGQDAPDHSTPTNHTTPSPPAPQRASQRATPEADFQDAVLELAAYRGWLAAHFRPALTPQGWRTPMHGDPGYPDLTLVRAGRVIFAELKDNGRSRSENQLIWAAALCQAELAAEALINSALLPLEPVVRYYLWCPADWPEIEDALR